MSDETLNLYPDKDGKFEVLQLTLQEENYCQLRAEGESRRAAWKTAYGVDGVNLATLDTRINRPLSPHPQNDRIVILPVIPASFSFEIIYCFAGWSGEVKQGKPK